MVAAADGSVSRRRASESRSAAGPARQDSQRMRDLGEVGAVSHHRGRIRQLENEPNDQPNARRPRQPVSRVRRTTSRRGRRRHSIAVYFASSASAWRSTNNGTKSRIGRPSNRACSSRMTRETSWGGTDGYMPVSRWGISSMICCSLNWNAGQTCIDRASKCGRVERVSAPPPGGEVWRCRGNTRNTDLHSWL